MSRSIRAAFLLAILAAVPACGHDSGQSALPPGTGTAQMAVSAQDSSVCSEGGMKVFQRAGGPGGPGCVCARLAGRDGNNVATLKLFDNNGYEQVLANVAKGSGANKWNDTWAAAGCP